MEKLEMKHLAPYLPYGLEIYCPNDDHEQIQVLSGLSKDDGIQTDYYKEHDGHNCRGNYWSFQGERNYQYYGIKPILHPLSRLTEPILDGNTPIDWLQDEYFTLTLHEQCKRILEDERWINHCDWLLIQHLFEWHFDVFGLIEKGLAIEKEAKTILKELK